MTPPVMVVVVVIPTLKLARRGNEAAMRRFLERLVLKSNSDIVFPLPDREVRELVVVVLLVARGEEAEAKRRRNSQRPQCRPPSRPRPTLLQRQARLPPRLRSRSQSHRLRVGRSPRAWLVLAGQAGPMRVVVLMRAWVVATTSKPGARHGEQMQTMVDVEYLLARAALRDVGEGGDAGGGCAGGVCAVFGGAGWR